MTELTITCVPPIYSNFRSLAFIHLCLKICRHSLLLEEVSTKDFPPSENETCHLVSNPSSKFFHVRNHALQIHPSRSLGDLYNFNQITSDSAKPDWTQAKHIQPLFMKQSAHSGYQYSKPQYSRCGLTSTFLK